MVLAMNLKRQPPYVIRIVADALAPNMRQAISNHHTEKDFNGTWNLLLRLTYFF